MYRLVKTFLKKSNQTSISSSSSSASGTGLRTFATTTTTTTGVNYTDPSKRNWDPRKIYPNEKGKVRVTGITLRDGHQSLNGGMHRIDLLEKAAVAINKIRPSNMPFPGHEEIGGGTVVDFPLRFKGENPFRNMEIISSKLTHTPTSCLIRSDSLCGYNVNPRDVVRAFLTRYAQCGLDIFRIFDAYNNVSNHATGAQAVIEAGKHYQAAITFTSHSDPTLFNVRWVADIAKQFAKLGAHSICIKDMAGIASPALMKAWVSEIKNAVPELPVIIHAHYTTGFSPITYLMAVEAGASAIDCGISTLSGRSGHPAMEVFNQVLADMGYDLGWDPVKALEGMKEVADIYREYHPRYEFCEMKMAGSVDYRVFTQGIPGGQISIMRNELVKNGYGHLFDNVIEQIQRVRTQVGGVALVTPTSEHVARQSIVNAMNDQNHTTDKSPLWPGYSEMLRGVMGRPPGEMQKDLQLRALKEWTEGVIKKMNVSDDVKETLQKSASQIVDYMWTLSYPIQEKQKAEELQQRIRQCRELNGKNSFIANEKYHFDERIKEFEKQLTQVLKDVPSDIESLEKRYLEILKGTPDPNTYEQILKGTGLKFLVNNKQISREQVIELIKAASFCTVCPSSILSDGMERARLEVEQLAVQHDFEYVPPRGSVEFEEWAILQCMFRHAQNIALFWFQHHQKNAAFWDKFFPKDFPFDRKKEDTREVAPLMYPYRSRVSTSQWNNGDKLTLEWSNTELKRVLQRDADKLYELQQHLKEVQSRKAENEYRKTINEKDAKRTKTRIDELEKKIRAKLKTSLYVIRSHEAGYEIAVPESIKKNYEKIGTISE